MYIIEEAKQVKVAENIPLKDGGGYMKDIFIFGFLK